MSTMRTRLEPRAGGRTGGDGRADGRRRSGRARTHTRAQGEPGSGRSLEGLAGWLGVREVGFSQK